MAVTKNQALIKFSLEKKSLIQKEKKKRSAHSRTDIHDANTAHSEAVVGFSCREGRSWKLQAAMTAAMTQSQQLL